LFQDYRGKNSVGGEEEEEVEIQDLLSEQVPGVVHCYRDQKQAVDVVVRESEDR
jgi:hypothetical protein